MKKFRELNKLGFFGFLGFISLVGVYTGKKEFFSFFAFFVFFQYFRVIPDELFKANLGRATTPAFFLTLASLAISMALSMLSNEVSILENGLGISYCIAIISFISVFAYLQYKEKKGLE